MTTSLRRSPRLQLLSDEREAAMALLSLRNTRVRDDILQRARVEAALARARRVEAAVMRLTAPRAPPQPTRRSARIAMRKAQNNDAEYIRNLVAELKPRIAHCNQLCAGGPSLSWKRAFFRLMDDYMSQIRSMVRCPSLLAKFSERIRLAENQFPTSRRLRNLRRDLDDITYMIREYKMDLSLGSL